MFRIVSKKRYKRMIELESLERRLHLVWVWMFDFDKFLAPLWSFVIHNRGKPGDAHTHFDKELKSFSDWLKKIRRV